MAFLAVHKNFYFFKNKEQSQMRSNNARMPGKSSLPLIFMSWTWLASLGMATFVREILTFHT